MLSHVAVGRIQFFVALGFRASVSCHMDLSTITHNIATCFITLSKREEAERDCEQDRIMIFYYRILEMTS